MNPVLLCYDGSVDAEHAIETAGWLLHDRDAIVLHVSKSVVDWGLGPSLGPLLEIPGVDEAIIANAQAVLTGGEHAATGAGFRVAGRLETTPRSVWQAVLRVAGEIDADVIVAGSHGRRIRNHLPLGSVTRGLVSHADRPLLITRREGAALPQKLPGTLSDHPVLVAFDGSQASAAALQALSVMVPHADVRVMSAWETPATLGLTFLDDTFAESINTLEHDLVSEAQSRAERGTEMARAYGMQARPMTARTDRGAGEAIIAAAREADASLIALGTHGHGFLTRALLGTTAMFVLQHADRPVLIVPAATLSVSPSSDPAGNHAWTTT